MPFLHACAITSWQPRQPTLSIGVRTSAGMRRCRYAGIAVPNLVIRGGRGQPYIARSAEILCGAMPNAFPVTVPGAAHSMMATHAAEVARLIGENVSKAETLT
jgi:pimeloyl-ACP methyl ester carboxylesterase